ncbi:MAG: nucleotidyltransferase domain-containing protein [Candidatus Bipolaricaulaceae bacterium]
MHKALERRRAEREERLSRARAFAEEAQKALSAVSIWVYGSVARGDFNLGSDVDVFLVAENLPEHPLTRSELLFRWGPPGVEPKGLTKGEFLRALAKKDAQLLRALRDRVLIRDDLGLEPLLAELTGAGPRS